MSRLYNHTLKPTDVRSIMKLISIFVLYLFALSPLAHSATQAQVFSTAAGPVTITPLNHASTLIEAGGKVIYLDPAKPVNWSGRPKADRPWRG